MADLIPFPIIANPVPWLAQAESKARARSLVAREIERLIGILDVMDGDPNLEEDDGHEDDDPAEDDDPGGGDVLDEPHDWCANLMPRYGIDQTRGPVNTAEARKAPPRTNIRA